MREERGLRTVGRKATEWLRKIWGLCWKGSGQKYKQEIKHKRQKESGRQSRKTSEDRVKVFVLVCVSVRVRVWVVECLNR